MVLPPDVKNPTSPGPVSAALPTVEGLVAGHGGVSVDAHQVDLVDEMVEIGDHVAGGADGRGAGGVEVVGVTPAAAGEGVLAAAALEPVGLAVAVEDIGAAAADRTLDPGQRVGLSAAQPATS